MSTQRNGSSRDSASKLNRNNTLRRTGSSSTASQPSRGYGSGLVSLGAPKKPRVPTAPERKLSVPKPVNLPSLRKENAGNDPTTQIVPAGGAGGWQKPEKEEPTATEAALTAGSNWASQPGPGGVAPWQPPEPFINPAPAIPRGRSLNPHEYPSLSAAAAARQHNVPKQPVPNLPVASGQGSANWDEDERKPSHTTRTAGADWGKERFEEEEDGAFRPPWEESRSQADWRGPSDGFNSGRGYGSSSYDEDYWGNRGSTPALKGPPPRPSYTSYDRFRSEIEDPTLFPPPPPPRQQPPPPPPKQGAEQSHEDAEADRRAFEAELDRVIEEERLRKQAEKEAPPEPIAEEPVEEPKALTPQPPAEPPRPPTPEAVVLTEEQQAAAAEAARLKAIAARKQRELEAEEADRKRKEAAAAKLKELEERIARKNAEKLALEKESEAVKDALADAEPQPESDGRPADVPPAQPEEEAVKEAADSAERTVKQDDAELKVQVPTVETASLKAEAGSNTEEPVSGEGDAVSLTTEEAIADTATSAVPVNAWSKPLTGAQTQVQSSRGWPPRESPPPLAPSVTAESVASAPNVPQEAKVDEPPAGALFPQGNKAFGPGAVASSLGVSPEEVPTVRPAKPVVPVEETPAQQAVPAVAPPVMRAPSLGMSWKAVLGGGEPTPEPAAPAAAAESKPAEGVEQVRERERGGRGGRGRERGRGRGQDQDGTPRDAAGGRGGRGPVDKERGRGRAARNRRDPLAKDADGEASVAAGPASVDGVPGGVQEGRKAAHRQRGEGAGGRGRGAKDLVEGRGRGKGRGQRNAVAAAAASAAPVSAAPGLIAAPGAIVPPPARSRSSEAQVAGVSPQAVSPRMAVTSLQAPTLPAPVAAPLPSTSVQPEGLPYGWGPNLAQEVSAIARLSLDPKPQQGGLLPALDPVAPMGTADARSQDRAIDRPKSAAGAVGRPKSGPPDHLTNDVLPNGIPVLPNDLSLDGPAPTTSQNPAAITFGFQPSSQGSSGGGGFGGVLFPVQPQNNPWQTQPLGSAAQHAPRNLDAAVQNWYNAPSYSNAFSSGHAAGSSPTPAMPQFGAFAHFPQFGQLGAGFGQPFVPTGKQPDWSTGPIAPSSQHKSEPVSSAPGSQAFSRSPGLDAIVPHSNIQRRGAPGPLGPPGLQRQNQGPPPFLGHQPFPNAPGPRVQAPPHHAPPGLQMQSQQHTLPPQQFNGPPRAGPFHGDAQIQVNFAQSQPQQHVQQGPPGIAPQMHRPDVRDQAAALPDDVFGSEDVRPADLSAVQQGPQANGGQARRGGNEAGRGRGRIAPQGRGAGGRNNLVRGQRGGRGQNAPAGPHVGSGPIPYPPMQGRVDEGSPIGAPNSFPPPGQPVYAANAGQHMHSTGRQDGAQHEQHGQGKPAHGAAGRGQPVGRGQKGRGRDRGRGAAGVKYVYQVTHAGANAGDGAHANGTSE